MRRRIPQLEWQFAEAPAEWESLTSPPATVTRPPLPRRVVWGGLLTLLVLLSAAGGWVWHTAHRGLVTLETEIGAAVNADVWRERQGTAEVQLVDLAADMAVVEVDLPVAAGVPAASQTRVYRQTPTGWTRTLPPAALWGRPRRLETTYFILTYYELDEAAVKAAAAHLDRLYPAFYAAFLGETPPAHKHLIEVDPAHVPGDFTDWRIRHAPMIVASPAAYLTPGTLTPEALLTQSIVLLLLRELEFEVNRLYVPTGYWGGYDGYSMAIPLWPLASGISLWQLWQADLPLAQWREPVVQWVLRAHVTAQPPVDPSFKPELCAMHRLWMESPIEAQLPFFCVDALEESEVTRLWFFGARRDGQGATLTEKYITPDQEIHLTREVMLATAVEYAAATYGPDRIPLLLATMGQHSQWETLVEDVFGVSAEAFEAGWAAYLEDQYKTGNAPE